MTIEELMEKLEPFIEQMAEAKAKEQVKLASSETSAEDKAEIAEKIAAYEQQNEEVKTLLEELKKDVDRKKVPGDELLDQKMGHEPAHKFKNIVHFMHDVAKAGERSNNETAELAEWHTACRDKAASSTSQRIGDSEMGGYIIPVEYAQEIWQRRQERSIILQQAFTIQMSSNMIKIPSIYDYDETSGKVAGNVQWFWRAEEADATASNMLFSQVELSLKKCTGLAYVSEEILKFSPVSSEALLRNAFDVGFNRAITKAFIRGTGVGEPLGVLEADATIEIAETTGQAADTFTIDNVVDMEAQFYPANDGIGDGAWHLNRQLFPQLIKMSLTVGAGGGPIFITNIHDKPDMSLFGAPIAFSTLMSAKGDSGDVLRADWGQYFVGQPAGDEGFEMVSSIHVQFVAGQTAFKFTFYMDGQPGWKTYMSPEYGDDMSPFLKLAAR